MNGSNMVYLTAVIPESLDRQARIAAAHAKTTRSKLVWRALEYYLNNATDNTQRENGNEHQIVKS